MNDRCNPTWDEIREWAFDADSFEPQQDWDLALASDSRYIDGFIELATDPACPNRGYFLHLLYLMVGNEVRRHAPRAEAETIIERGDANDSAAIKTWQARSRALLAAPQTFDYNAWCLGGLASTPHND